MSESDLPKIHLSHDDPIECLGLNKRSRRCLLRGGIHTIRELINLIETDRLQSIYGVGGTAANEIEASVRKFNLMGPGNIETARPAPSRQTTTEGGVATRIKYAPTVSNEAIARQLADIEQLMQSGLLDQEAKILGKSISYWMNKAHSLDPRDGFDLLRVIVCSSASICDELAYIFDQLPNKYIKVLMLRYGHRAQEFEDIGDEIGVGGARVRQISNDLGLKIRRCVEPIFASRSVSIFENRPALLRIQTALNHARRRGMRLCFSEWERSIIRSGLVGDFRKSKYADIDPMEALIAMCSVPIQGDPDWLKVPKNLTGC